MSHWTRFCVGLTLFGLAWITVATAQDKDAKEPDKSAKKEDKDKEVKGKEDKGKEDKEPVEEKLVYGQMLQGKLLRFDSGTTKGFVVQVYFPDPMKIFNFNKWIQDQQRGIATAGNIRDRQQRLFNFNQELAKRKANPLNTMSAKDVELRAADNIRTRSLYPPLEYTDKGDLKKWTPKELAALKGKSKLPGYPVDYDALRPNQMVQVYLAKVEAPKGGVVKKKLDDDVELGSARPEVVLIVIAGEEVK